MFVAAGLLLANVYTSMVDARSWGSDIPNSIATARDYFKTVNPGNFFRIFSPLNQVLALLALVLFWKPGSDIRLCLGITLLLYVLSDVMTFAYFYPRNDFMFRDAALTDVSGLTKAWSEWSSMNWVRSAMLLAGMALSALSLQRMYSSAS